MSEKKPFDAAIKILFGYTDYGTGTIGEVKGRSCEAAIRVLEAAGKVNKKSSIRELDAMYKSRIVDLTEHSRGGNIQFDFSLELKETADINYQLIRALLESLPEKEE